MLKIIGWGCGGLIGVAMLLLVAIYVIGRSGSGTANQDTVTTRTINGDGWLGCSSLTEYRGLVRLVGDRAAWQRAVLTSACRPLTSGTRVTFMDSQGDLVQLHAAGDPTPFWTSAEAIYR